jgi:pantetheine-phosphate adenylyltransferase
MDYLYSHATVAGTFDHFHAGHRALIDEVFRQAEHVSVGVAVSELSQHKLFSTSIEPMDLRLQTIEDYLKIQNYIDRATIFDLKTVEGIALQDPTLDAIFVTPDTVANAEKINYQRTTSGMTAMEAITVPMAVSDDGQPISSTRIRQGLVSRDGVSYIQPFLRDPVFTATPLVRDELAEPMGDVIGGIEEDITHAAEMVKQRLKQDNPPVVIAVGDIVTRSLHMVEVDPQISVIDNRTRRTEIEEHYKSPFQTQTHGPFRNEAGTISSAFVTTVYEHLSELATHNIHRQYVIQGEEDLLGLPMMLLAPLESVVLYGQYEQGIVYVCITEEVKSFCWSMLKQFE